MTEKILTVSEVARLLRVDGTTVRRWIKKGKMEAVELPNGGETERHGYRIRASEVKRIAPGLLDEEGQP